MFSRFMNSKSSRQAELTRLSFGMVSYTISNMGPKHRYFMSCSLYQASFSPMQTRKNLRAAEVMLAASSHQHVVHCNYLASNASVERVEAELFELPSPHLRG